MRTHPQLFGARCVKGFAKMMTRMDYKSSVHRLQPREDFKLPKDHKEKCHQLAKEILYYDRGVTDYGKAS
jgi:hypothetical protein